MSVPAFPLFSSGSEIAVGAFALFMVIRSRPGSPWGFSHVVKYPEIWNAIAESSQELERSIEAARQWPDGRVAGAVKSFLFDVTSNRDAWEDAQVLRGLGDRTHPAVLGVLADASLHARLVKPTREDLLPEAPFNRACDLLGDTPPAEAGTLVALFLEDQSKEIRQDAAFVLGKIGTPEVVPALQKALGDSDKYVRSHALMGLEYAIEAKRLGDECKRQLYRDVESLLGQGKNADDAARLLLHLDREQAIAFFLSDAMFTPDSASLHEALEALANAQVRIPRSGLLALIEQVEAGDLEYPRMYTLREALRLLGEHRSPEDRAFLERRMTHNERTVAEGAAAGLLALHGLGRFPEQLWKAEEQRGYAELAVPQRHCIAVYELNTEVNNGGLSQYFVNSSGDHWRDALAGLEAMGFTERACVLREAVAKFGKEGPSDNRSIRQEQLAKLARKNDALFDALDDRCYKSTEVVDVFVTRYVLGHPDSFGKKTPT